MAQSLSKNELGNGLPLCLSSLLKLQKPLYLSGQRRHRVLQGIWVRSRIGDDLQAETDEAVILAFYSDPRNRKELWDHWRANSPPAAPVPHRRKGGRPEDEPPPSLEYCILDNLDRNLLQSEGSDDVLIDRLTEEVDSRLDRWSEADNAERRQTVRLAFALASLRNDRSVLQRAVERVEKLAEEFEKLLQPVAADTPPNRNADSEAPGAAPTELEVPAAGSGVLSPELVQTLQQVETTIDSAFSSVHDLVEKIEDSESLEIFGGFATSVEDRVQTLQGGLTARRKQLESRLTVEELQARAAGFLISIAENPAAAGIRGDLDQLTQGWTGLGNMDPQEALAELARLKSEVPAAVGALDRARAEHDALKEERRSLSERQPENRAEQQDLDERLDAVHEREVTARKRHREAEDALLKALAPTIRKVESPVQPTTPTGAQQLLDARFSANRDLFDGASADEVAVKGDETESREAEIGKQRTPEPVEAPAEPNEPVPPEEPTRPKDSAVSPVETSTPDADTRPGESVAKTGPADETISASEGEPANPPVKAAMPESTAARPEALEASEAGTPDHAASEPGTPEEAERQTVPTWNDRQQAVRRAVAQALADDPPRLAEAFQICRLADELEIAAGQPQAPIVEAALYASHLRRAHGDLASELGDVIETAPNAPPAGSTPARKNAEALLRFAGTLVPALLAPSTAAAVWIQRLTHEGLPSLYDFAGKVATRSWAVQRAGIDPGSFLRQARRRLDRGAAMAALQDNLAKWRAEAPKQNWVYVPAKKVWNALLMEGSLQRLLSAIVSEADAARVRTELAEIEDRDSLRKLLDDLSDQELRKGQSIDQKSFKQFRRRLNRPCELAHEYIGLTETATGRADHRQQVLMDLVGLVKADAPDLRAELATLKEGQKQDPLVRAAASVASRALLQAENLVNSNSATDDLHEPVPDLVRASGLFLYPEIRIDDSGLAEGDSDEALDALLADPVASVEAALEERIDAADLASAGRILDWPATADEMDDDDIERWRNRLDSTREEHIHSLREEAETLRDDLESAYLHGQLTPDERLGIDGGLTSLEDRIKDGEIARFDRDTGILDGLRRNLEGAKRKSLETLRKEARRRWSKEDPGRLEKIEGHIDDGDLVAANELLFRSRDSGTRPAEEAAAAGSVLDTYIATGRDALRSATKDWTAVVAAAKEGRRHDVLEFDQLAEDDLASASGLVESWSHLRTSPRRSRARVAKAVREIFGCLGFDNVHVPLDGSAASAGPVLWTGELRADPLSGREQCAIAQFGSSARGRYRLLVYFDPLDTTKVVQKLGGPHADQAAIVVCAAPLPDRQRQQLVSASFEKKLPFVLLDECLLAFLASRTNPCPASFFALSLPFSHCQAFQTRSSFVPPEMFFGREREWSQIIDFENGSCFVYGGRQLGKTALLRRVQEEFTSPVHGQFAVWIDLKAGGVGDADTSDLWAVIWKHLRELDAIDESVRRPTRDSRSVETFCDALHARFNPETRGRLLILLDEADNFLQRDALNSSRSTFAESSRLKELMEKNRSIKVVFAGLHNVLRTTSQSNHPLAHMGEPIRIGPFIRREERQQAEDLIRVPLQACGYRFEPRRLTRSVLARANYYPSLLQIYGNAISDRLSATARRRSPNELAAVDLDLLDRIHRDRDFQEEIRKRFVWTLELDPRYEAIAYIVANKCHESDRLLHDGVDAARLLNEARGWWEAEFGAGYDIRQFVALLEEMVELGVLRLAQERGPEAPTFTLRNPNVLALLGSAQTLEDKLLALAERPATRALTPREIRRRDDEKGPLHRPLTLHQEYEVEGRYAQQGASRNEVILVGGTEAAGAGHALAFLAGGMGEVERLKASRNRDHFESGLKNRLQSRKAGTTLFLCDATAKNWREDWLDVARESLDNLYSRSRFARIVFTLGASGLMANRRVIMQREEKGDLRLVVAKPWSIDFASHVLDDDREVGHRLNQQHERTLAELAGGWPVLLEAVLQTLREGTQPGRLATAVGFGELLRKHEVKLRKAFALNHEELVSVLELARVCGTATEDDLLDPDARRLAACALGDNELQSAIWAAAKLHLLEATGPAEWRIDPVVEKILPTRPG